MQIQKPNIYTNCQLQSIQLNTRTKHILETRILIYKPNPIIDI